VRERVRELNSAAVRRYAEFLHLEGDAAAASADPLFMHIAIIGLCEFFAAAQAMILPLKPKQLDAAKLMQHYEMFIRNLILDGVRSRIELPRVKAGA
jgi:hypothetical protein